MASTAPVDTLPDSLLAKIFSYLPLKERYLTCLVSPKWAAASRISWTDIKSLNLKSVPASKANAILDLCPNVRKVGANVRKIELSVEPAASTSPSVRIIVFRNVRFEAPGLDPAHAQSWLTNYFSRFPNLVQLMLMSVPLRNGTSVARSALPLILPPPTAMSLRRLVLINSPVIGHVISAALRETHYLECLYLVENEPLDYCVFGLPELRELCLVSEEKSTLGALANGVVCGRFPKLEVIIYASRFHIDPKSIAKLITAELPLRIFAVAGRDELLARTHGVQGLLHPAAGNFQEAIVPPRPDFSSSGQLRFPPLQIFVGGDFTKCVRFRLPPANVAQFWRIDRPMPEFLAQPEVAAVFEDVWVAKFIHDMAFGVQPWGNPNEKEKFYTTGQLLFW